MMNKIREYIFGKNILCGISDLQIVEYVQGWETTNINSRFFLYENSKTNKRSYDLKIEGNHLDSFMENARKNYRSIDLDVWVETGNKENIKNYDIEWLK